MNGTELGVTSKICFLIHSPIFNSLESTVFSSDVWNTVPKNIREKLLSIKDDGEFWMEYRDFLKIFDYLDICHKNPDFFRTEDSARWKTFMTNCAWVAGVNNGGSAKSAGKY